MAPTTGLAFVAAGISLWGAPRLREPGASLAWGGLAAATGLGCLGLLAWRAFGPHSQPTLAAPVPGAGWRPFFGRMSPWSAWLFIAASSAKLLRFRERAGPSKRTAVSQGLTVGVLLISGFVLAGMGFRSPLLQEGGLIPIAPPAALGFHLLALGQLCEGDQSWGWQWLHSPTLFARLTRKTIPAMLALVVIGGWMIGAVLIRFAGEGRLVGAALVTALIASLMALLTGAVAAGIQREVDLGQRALQEREERLRTTLDSIGDGVLTTDLEGRIISMNPVAEALTGWSRDQALGRDHAEILRLLDSKDRQPLPDLTERVLQLGETYTTLNPNFLLARDGTELRVSENAAPIRDGSGQVMGMVIALRDMTRYIELEEKLRQSQKMDAIGQLSGGVAHDFNNMLLGIQGGAELLALRLPKDPQLAGYVRMIKDGALRATDLTAKLLAFARKGKVISTGVDIHEILKAAFLLLERSIDPRIRLDLALNARHSTAVGDPTMLQNVFLNLGINARDAMPEGGTLRFSTRDVRIEESEAGLPPFNLEPGPYLEITVADTGSGIAPEVLDKVFEPFFTTKSVGHGTGLGLAAVYGGMKEHHGAVTVTSELGRGTTFRLLIPSTAAEVSPLASREEEAIAGEGCVLVIEDEAIVRSVATSLLESLGYTVILAEDGLAGVEVFQRERHRIDLVLLDLVMPRLGGKETLLRLRELQPEVKVLLCSGFDHEGHLGELIRYGANGFIQKPYRRVALGEALARIRTASGP